jgi:hypothetical protein
MTPHYLITITDRDGNVVSKYTCTGEVKHTTSDKMQITFDRPLVVKAEETVTIEYRHTGSANP